MRNDGKNPAAARRTPPGADRPAAERRRDSGPPGVAAAGPVQAAAAQIAPALDTFTSAARQARGVAPGQHAVIAVNLQATVQVLAIVISGEGYAAKHRWQQEFGDGPAAAGPDWLYKEMDAAAQRVMDGASELCAVRSLPSGDVPSVALLTESYQAWRAVDGLDQVMRGQGQHAAQVPEHAVVIAGLAGACKALAAALGAEGTAIGRCHGDEVAALFGFARRCALDSRAALIPVARTAAGDVTAWRQRRRPGLAG
jgi:hypothetical protein